MDHDDRYKVRRKHHILEGESLEDYCIRKLSEEISSPYYSLNYDLSEEDLSIIFSMKYEKETLENLPISEYCKKRLIIERSSSYSLYNLNDELLLSTLAKEYEIKKLENLPLSIEEYCNQKLIAVRSSLRSGLFFNISDEVLLDKYAVEYKRLKFEILTKDEYCNQKINEHREKIKFETSDKELFDKFSHQYNFYVFINIENDIRELNEEKEKRLREYYNQRLILIRESGAFDIFPDDQIMNGIKMQHLEYLEGRGKEEFDKETFCVYDNSPEWYENFFAENNNCSDDDDRDYDHPSTPDNDDDWDMHRG